MDTALMIIALTGLYFLPTIAAVQRKNHAAAVFVINLFLGWSLVGWVVAMAMALWNNNAKPAAV